MNPRAWASVFAFCALLGLALLVALMPRADEPETLPACRALTPKPAAALACLDGLGPNIVVAELAGRAERWHCLLQRGAPVATPGLQQRACAEQRTQRLRDEVRGFDQGLFIPLYAGLSALLAAWSWSHARLCAAPRPDRVRTTALALVGTTMLLVGLDLWENARLLAMLDLLDHAGAAPLAGAPTLDPAAGLEQAARTARQVSSLKWLACAPWALCLGLALHAVLRWAPAAAAPRAWCWLGRGAWLLALIAGALMAIGGAAGLSSPGLRLPVQALSAGTLALIAALAAAAVAAAWGTMKRGIPFTATLPALPPAQSQPG